MIKGPVSLHSLHGVKWLSFRTVMKQILLHEDTLPIVHSVSWEVAFRAQCCCVWSPTRSNNHIVLCALDGRPRSQSDWKSTLRRLGDHTWKWLRSQNKTCGSQRDRETLDGHMVFKAYKNTNTASGPEAALSPDVMTALWRHESHRLSLCLI